MKKTFLLLLTGTLFIGCSSDDDSGTEGPVTGAIYLPLTTGNHWTYDVEGSTLSGRDSLYVANDTLISGNTYKKMKTRELPAGFLSAAVRENGARYQNGAVIVSGNVGVNLGVELPIALPLSNFMLLKENASVNEQLASVSGEIEDEIENYPIEISYNITSTAKEALPTFTSPNGDTYTDVKSVQVKLNISISTTMEVFVGFPVTIEVLAPQDVVVSNMYFAKDIGMVYAHTVSSYELEDLPTGDFELPIPQSGTETTTEFLDSYVAD